MFTFSGGRVRNQEAGEDHLEGAFRCNRAEVHLGSAYACAAFTICPLRPLFISFFQFPPT